MQILVLDEEPRQLETICRGLFVCGHDASPVRSLEDAKALISARGDAGFDLLLTDVRSPDDPAVAIIVAVRAIAPSVPLLVTTGLTDGPRLAAVRALGTPLLVKPFTPDELDAAVRAAARRARDPR